MPFSETFGDHFYAREDGRAETAHVFLGQNGLPERWKTGSDFVIGELGFGTGLNFLETWRQWIETRSETGTLTFATFEAFPMERNAIEKAISRWPELAGLCARLIETWDSLSGQPQRWQMDGQTVLEVHVGEALSGVATWSGAADAWYLDGFAPSRNPDMWSAELMQAVHDHTRAGGTFASYTAAGWVRRNLQAAGFTVEKIAGHGAKRDMIRGHRA